MIIDLKRLYSAANVANARLGRAGQMATLFLLMIGGVLIFTLMTANLGQTTVTATRLANTADAGASQLGSSLATKSQILYNKIGGEKKCYSGGMLGSVLAIVMIVIVIVVAVFTMGGAGAALLFAAQNMLLTMGVLGAAGAVGGAIGGGITGGGQGALMGAFQGAMLGAAIGGGISAAATSAGFGAVGAGAGSATAGAEGAVIVSAEGTTTMAAGATVPATGNVAVVSGSVTTASGTTVGAGGTVAGGGAVVGSGGEIVAAGMGAASGGAGAGGAAGAGETSSAAIGASSESEVAAITAAEAAPAAGSTTTAASSSVLSTVQSVMGSPYMKMGQVLFGAGSNLYNASVKEQIRDDAVDKFTKAINGLPEYDNIREGIMFQSFTRTVDDPNKRVDEDDSDEDGNTTEEVPQFQWWWGQRKKGFEAILPLLQQMTYGFLDGPLATFESQARKTYTPAADWGQVCSEDEFGNSSCTPNPGPFQRLEVEGVDGSVVALARALVVPAVREGAHRNQIYPLDDPLINGDQPFWAPGPAGASSDPIECEESSCPPPPPGYDEVDLANDTLQEFVHTVAADNGFDQPAGLRDSNMRINHRIVSSWQSWIKLLDDPDPATDVTEKDFRDRLHELIQGESAAEQPNPANRLKGILAWKQRLEQIRSSLPVCTYTTPMECNEWGECWAGTPYIDNAPCREGAMATVDQDRDDEFAAALKDLDWIVDKIQTYQPAPSNFTQAMRQEWTNIGIQANPVRYDWTDSRGEHWVEVEVGAFRIAYVKTKKSGNALKKTICVILKDHSDSGANTWVKVKQFEPPGPDTPLWQWNGAGGQTFCKIARASYSYSGIQLASIGNCQ